MRLLLDPLCCCFTEFLHGEQHRFTRVRREEIDDVLMNVDVHKSELVACLASGGRQTNVHYTAVATPGLLLHETLLHQAFDDPRDPAAREEQSPGKFAGRKHFITLDSPKQLELGHRQVQLFCRALDLDLAIFEQLIGEICHLLSEFTLVGDHRRRLGLSVVFDRPAIGE